MCDDSPQDDLQWIRAAKAGDPEARRQFVERMVCVPRFVEARNRRAGSPLDPEAMGDLVQDVQVLVWTKLEEFEGRALFESWVYRFCHLRFMKALERLGGAARREQELAGLAESLVAPATELLQEVELAEGEGELHALLRHLGPREAQVARLMHLEGLTLAETARELSVSVSSVKTHYYRGLDKLRVVLTARVEDRT